MARPKSEEKRTALLAAATRVVAEEGLAAPTARIAREADVAHGSLFNYFETKSDLVNQLYLELKADLQAALMKGYPVGGSVRERLLHVWQAWLTWGTSSLAKRKALAQLQVSDQVTKASREEATTAAADILGAIGEASADGALRGQPMEYIASLMDAMAGVTMDFMLRDKAHSSEYRRAGFEAFWKALAKE